jgi:hypothetical protein
MIIMQSVPGRAFIREQRTALADLLVPDGSDMDHDPHLATMCRSDSHTDFLLASLRADIGMVSRARRLASSLVRVDYPSRHRARRSGL